MRDTVFAAEGIFSEPAWDLMLDLYVAACERKKVSVTSACLAASVPPTTALRWLAIIERKGWVERRPDPADARRCHVLLTDEGQALMTGYLDRLAA